MEEGRCRFGSKTSRRREIYASREIRNRFIKLERRLETTVQNHANGCSLPHFEGANSFLAIIIRVNT